MTKDSSPDTESATGRRNEIEITPEMIEAGADAAYDWDWGGNITAPVVAVFSAMLAARS